jgi:zinc transporter 1/2/3
MYFHTLFEGIAIGVQDTIGGFLSTAIAIAFHKWADALSMGIQYRNRGVKPKIAYWLIIGQAALNAFAIGLGWIITNFGDLTEAIFLAISAGTFLAISTMEMLGEELHRPSYRAQKFIVLLLSTGFICSVWFFENAIFN